MEGNQDNPSRFKYLYVFLKQEIITSIVNKKKKISIAWSRRRGGLTCRASNIAYRMRTGTSENDPTINAIDRERVTIIAFPQKVGFPSGVVICISGRNLHLFSGNVKNGFQEGITGSKEKSTPQPDFEGYIVIKLNPFQL